MSEQTIRQVAEQIDNHPLCSFTLEQITDAVKALAAHVLAEPLGEAAEVAREIATDVIVADLRAQLKTAQCSAEDRLRQIRQIAKQSADLRAQLQAAEQERDKFLGVVECANAAARRRDVKITELQSLADERGREVERLVGLLSAFAQVAQGAIDSTRATTPPAHKEMDAKR